MRTNIQRARARQTNAHVSMSLLAFQWRTDLDLLFDWSTDSMSSTISASQRSMPLTTSIDNPSLSRVSFSIDAYARLSLGNFLFASLISIVREPAVFWSISKAFSLIYSLALTLNVIQWCLMYGAFQLLVKNICFPTIGSTHRTGYLLIGQPYTAFFLYLLLEFLVYISSITFYYYAYIRFKYHHQSRSSCYDRCSHYCPSLIAVVLLLLYTSCKMPLVHDIFLLYIQTRLQLLFLTFIFEIVHVLLVLALWIFLTTKVNWRLVEHAHKPRRLSSVSSHGLTVKNTSTQPTAVSLPELTGACTSTGNESRRLSDNIYQKPYEKIRIFQSEIYYRNRPKNWSLPLNQQSAMLATFDHDDEPIADNDLIVRSPSYPTNHMKTHHNQEVQYRDAIRKTVSNLYQHPVDSQSNQHHRQHHQHHRESRHSRPVVPLDATHVSLPTVKRFTQEQVDAARHRTQHMMIQQRPADHVPQQHRSTALLISQV
jgi:hypothetical protein